MENGYRVPEDVVISGYDYTMEGKYHTPRITTVRCRFRQIGVESCKLLLDMAEGKEVPDKVQLPDEVILEESCGCHGRRTKDDENKEKQFMSADILQRIFIHHMISLEKSLTEDTTMEQWLRSLSVFIQQIDPVEF